jgi:hypothetical protein
VTGVAVAVQPKATPGLDPPHNAGVRVGVAGLRPLLEPCHVLEAQPRGTLALWIDQMVCRALEEPRTRAACALRTGPGM